MIKLEANGSIKEDDHVGVNLDFEADGSGRIVLCELSSIFVSLIDWDKDMFTSALEMALRRKGLFKD